ncbi:MAG: glycosyltransferase [Lachnospiraceae bacterium]|nr:glycosyltransferase [Lachnospiraceae bacterium]
MVKVSLLVTTYNDQDNLEITLTSIESQDYQKIEVVIVDGQSKDKTPELIKKFAGAHQDEADFISVKWISEPDKGLYDAMNKAFGLSNGDIIAVCNDKLCREDAVSKLVRAIEQGGSGCIGAHADLVYMEGERIVRSWHMGEGNLRQGWMPGHPTLFLKREIYERYGIYDTRYRCAADYEFMVRFLKDEDNRLAYVPEVLVAMFYGGTSNAGLSNYLISFKEGYQALRKNKVKFPFWITVKRTLRVLKQF